MAPENDWLSFSLSSMEMLNNTSAQPADDSQHFYSFADNFYANGWANQKAEPMYSEAENQQLKEQNSLPIYTGYMQPPPKLEDFFAGGGGDSTETHEDSSLTHIYDHHHTGAYFSGGEPQDLKTYGGFQAFPANSGSEVDDSAFGLGQTQSPAEMGSELVAYSQSPCPVNVNLITTTNNALSLGVNHHHTNNNSNNNNKNTAIVSGEDNQTGSCKKVAETFGQRTSIYRGVTRHRWTGRYEAHLWDNSCRREGQARKGRQGSYSWLVLLHTYPIYNLQCGYDKEDKAARSYDLAALKYWGSTATTNFPISNYTKEIDEMKHATKQEFIASLRRKSSGFSRGASIYRGITRHHQQGPWQARIGRVAGNKDLYLGTFATEEEAAEAYDIAAIKFRGINAVTNFEMNRYDVEAIAKSPLPVGGTAKRLKLSLEAEQKIVPLQTPMSTGSSNNINFSNVQSASTIPFCILFDSTAPFYHHNLFHHHVSPILSASDSSMPMNLMSSSTPEFFIWPHHQPY
ncbi:hypothetical protein CASFOL_042736 [Castilleja foliolosa]|uniref:AP2/ERF domain-containing protein n=1 Tax=Castilleja foliolosa TaxID=1961234 RepID=A0ABD3B8G6_9LAMI